MLPSPGFSIPSIGTPVQHLEEDQQIIANNPYYAQHPMMNTTSTGLTPIGMGNTNSSNNGVGSSGLTKEAPPSLPPLTLPIPSKLTSSYQPSYAPQSMIQPQTPVSILNSFLAIESETHDLFAYYFSKA